MNTVIIGMGPAGMEAARTLREQGYAGEITMFSAEKALPYSPPALGEYLLTGNEKALFWQGRDVCNRYRLDCHLNERVLSIDPAKKTLLTEQGSHAFDKAVIASGSSLYAPLPGSKKKGICNFKTLEGTRQIRALAEQKPGSTALIIGGGFIGVEIALCLAKIGLRPTLLNRRGWIMPRLLDPETAEYVLRDLKKAGVRVRLDTEAQECIGKEQVEGVRITEDETLQADLYIAATGVKPNIGFLQNSTIAHGWGITVNKYLQATYPFIYACGDVAETTDLMTGNTKIHGLYPVAVAHGRTAAMNIMGAGIPYEHQLNMNSLKELIHKVIVVGRQTKTVLKRKDKKGLRKLYLHDGKIVGFVLAGNISGAGTYLAMMRKGTDVAIFGDRLLSRQFNTAVAMTKMVRRAHTTIR